MRFGICGPLNCSQQQPAAKHSMQIVVSSSSLSCSPVNVAVDASVTVTVVVGAVVLGVLPKLWSKIFRLSQSLFIPHRR